MAAPVVEDINSLIAKYRAALAPQSDQIDQAINANDQSGTAQMAGLNATRDQSFQNIEQTASNKGMGFSGFAPDAEAKYLGSAYLPAVAKLQEAIASARAGLQGKKADLATKASDAAISEQNSQKSALQTWQDNQEKMAYEARQAELNRQASTAAAYAKASSKAPTAAQQKQQMYSDFSADASSLFNGIDVRPAFYTENVVIPKLRTLYPEMSDKEIASLAYAYRKSNYGF